MLKILRNFIFIISLLNISQTVQAEYNWTSNCKLAYEEAMRLNFSKANQIVAIEKKQHPTNLIPLYIESQIDFLQSFIFEERTILDGLKTRNDLRIAFLQKSKEESPFKRLCIAEMYLQMAIARVKFEEYFGAAYDVRKSFKLLEENQQRYPDFKPNLRGLGLIHAAVGSIPKNNHWVAGILGLEGTIKQGLSELKILLNATYKDPSLSYLRDETIVIITFLELNLGKEKDNNVTRRRFYPIKDLEKKPLLLFAKSIFHSSAAENDSVIELLSRRSHEINGNALVYLNYMEANARLYNMDYSAEKLYLKYISEYTGKTYVMSAWQRLAWVRLLQGDEVGYKSYMSKIKVSKKGQDFTDEDKAAIKEAQSGETPNVILLHARLLFDGGYYQRALAMIAGKPVASFPRLRDQLELTYRLARIFDKQNKKEKAIEYYEITLKNGAEQSYYFAANSALLIGQIYEDAGNKTKAVEYYNKTLEMRDHEYQNGIDQKAKAGLNRLENK